MRRSKKKQIYRALVILPALFVCVYLLQHIWAQRHKQPENVKCVPLLGWFTMEDRIPEKDAVAWAKHKGTKNSHPLYTYVVVVPHIN